MNIIKFALENPVKVFVAIFFVLVFGVQAVYNMPYRLIPSIESPQISVRTSWAGASPYEMEKEIIDKQERVLKTIPGVVDYEGMASNGFSYVSLLFDIDVDVNDAMLLVLNKLNEVRSYPDNVDNPTIRSANSDSTSVIDLVLKTTEGNERSIEEYGTYFDETLRSYIDRVIGVADLSVWGGTAAEIQITIDPALLSVHNISVTDISTALTRENVDVSGGDVSFGQKDFRFRTLGEVESVQDIKDIVIRSGDNSRVTIGDIATVEQGYAKASFINSYGNQKAMMVGVIAEAGANVLQLSNDLETVILELNDTLLKEQGLEFVWIYDQRNYILSAIDLVKSNIIVGGILAVLILLLFLRSVRSTLVIAVTIPICIVGTFFIMNATGRSLNVLSLAGIAFSVGMLIDNSIVVLENISTKISQGKKAFQAAYEGASEVWGAILASTMTTIAVFLPIAFVKEEMGQMFGDIAIAISSAVGLSMISAMVVIPVLMNMFYKNKETRVTEVGENIGAFGNKLVDMIVSLSVKINSRFTIRLAVIVGLTIASVSTAYLLMPKMNFLPTGNKNMIYSFIQTAPGLSADERKEMNDFLYEQLEPYIGEAKDGYPAIKDFVFISGNSMVRLMATAEDGSVVRDIIPLIQKYVSMIPGITGSTSQSTLFNIGRGSGNMLSLNVSGSMPYEELTAKVNAFQNGITAQIPGAQVRISPSPTPVYPEVQIIPNREALSAVGLTTAELGSIIDVVVDGAKIAEFKDDTLGTIDVVMKSINDEPKNPDEVSNIMIPTNTGTPVPIYAVADVYETMGVDRIRRFDGVRAFSVSVSVPGSSMVLEELTSKVIDDVFGGMKENGEMDGVIVQSSGSQSKLESAQKMLINNFGLAIVITYLLLSALFNNFLYPFIILFSIPLAASGGFIGLWAVNTFIAEQALDVITMLGFIMLIGTVVNNPILIVYETLMNLRGGMPKIEAITNGLRSRIRPIFMSTLTSLFGMLPLVVFPGEGSELYRGLGSVILGGLGIATIFTLFVIPALLATLLPERKIVVEDNK